MRTREAVSQAEWAKALRRIQAHTSIQTAADLKLLAGRVRDLQREIQNALAGWSTVNTPTGAMMVAHLKDLEDRVGQIVDHATSAMSEDWRGSWQTWWKMGSQRVQDLARVAGVPLTELAIEVNRLEQYERFIPELIQQVGADTKASISKVIRTAALAGTPRADVNRRIMALLKGEPGRASLGRFGGWAYQVERIYRTESHRLADLAAHEAAKAWKRQGVQLVKVWLHMEGGGSNRLSRGTHVRMHGKTEWLTRPFVVDGERMMHPHDPGASARNTINCMCYTVHLPPDVAASMGYTLPPGAAPRPGVVNPKPSKPSQPVTYSSRILGQL